MEDFRNDFYNCCFESLFYSEFVNTTAIDEEVKMVEDYVCQNYQSFNLDSLEALDLELLDKDTIYKIASLKLAEIESNTLELELK
jgi:hypothetical protein